MSLVGAGVFVKPYALILVPWLLFAAGISGLVAFAATFVGGLLLPATVYGWSGNLEQVRGWYRTVTDTTAPNLLAPENVSVATMWAKWLGPGPQASSLATVDRRCRSGRGSVRLDLAASSAAAGLPRVWPADAARAAHVAAGLGLRPAARDAGGRLPGRSLPRDGAPVADRHGGGVRVHELHDLRPARPHALRPDDGAVGRQRRGAGSRGHASSLVRRRGLA